MEFVVGASEATMRSLLGKLGGLLAQEYTLIRGVRGDIQYINDELTTMQAFLGDVSSVPDNHDRRLKDWMKQIRDMAYDTEDCIDDFAHRLPHDSLGDGRCSFIVTIVYELWTLGPRRDIASKIAELKIRAQQIAERRGRYGVDNPGNSNSSSSSLAGTSRIGRHDIAEHLMGSRELVHTEKPVGVAADMKKLGDWLKKPDNASGKHRTVLSIVGFGGLGKTTIATALYRDFRNEFDCRASVTVSQNYDEDEVLRDILGQIKPQDSEHEQQGSSKGGLEERNLAADIKSSVKLVVALSCGQRKSANISRWKQNNIETMNHDQLVKELKGRLNGKRYLLLIDDIWSAETWDDIKYWLPHDNTKDSKVIVTTRFQAVGTACSEGGTDLHTVDVLNDVDSKSLFNQSVNESKTSKKEHVHEDIWKYCGGLPLAIVSMAGLVACNPSKPNGYWSTVCKSLLSEQVTPLTLDGVTSSSCVLFKLMLTVYTFADPKQQKQRPGICRLLRSSALSCKYCTEDGHAWCSYDTASNFSTHQKKYLCQFAGQSPASGLTPRASEAPARGPGRRGAGARTWATTPARGPGGDAAGARSWRRSPGSAWS